MATTWIKPLHVNKGKTIGQTIISRTGYAGNPNKTENGELVIGYQCDPRTVDVEFLLSKNKYFDITGKKQGKHDILAYHVRQAFKPNEITPEAAGKLGYELAMRFTKGRHAFIVATHVDRKHIHNHIIFNSTTLDCTKKFQNPLHSNKIIRRISDQICAENGLSIIENPKLPKGNYGTWLGDRKQPSWRQKLQAAIDNALEKKPADLEAFCNLLRELDIDVKHRGDSISLRIKSPDSQGVKQKRFINLRTLGKDYSIDAICKRIINSRTVSSKKLNLLIDIQNSIKAQNSAGYAQWSKVFNIKTAASTLVFLQENGLDDIEKLRAKAQEAKENFNGISTRIQDIDARLKDVTALQKHIGAYKKTRDVYAAYRKAGYSKKYLAEHENEIALHKEAKQYFDTLKLEKLPTIKTLQTEYAALSDEKKKLYAGYTTARKHMISILTAKQNAESLLNYSEAARKEENVME